jgi:hypothetical protein
MDFTQWWHHWDYVRPACYHQLGIFGNLDIESLFVTDEGRVSH